MQLCYSIFIFFLLLLVFTLLLWDCLYHLCTWASPNLSCIHTDTSTHMYMYIITCVISCTSSDRIFVYFVLNELGFITCKHQKVSVYCVDELVCQKFTNFESAQVVFLNPWKISPTRESNEIYWYTSLPYDNELKFPTYSHITAIQQQWSKVKQK